jgi:hypothetical protein
MSNQNVDTCRNCKYCPNVRKVRSLSNPCYFEIEQYCPKGRFDVINALDTAKCIHFELIDLEDVLTPIFVDFKAYPPF